MAGVLLVAGGHLATLQWPVVHGVFVGVAVLCWLVWIAVVSVRDPDRRRRWGFRREGLAEAVAWCGALIVGAALAMGVAGWMRGTLTFEAHYVFPLLLYPLWGGIQQLLVQGVIARRLSERWPTWATVAVAAALFGLIHVPFPALMGLTFVMGLFLTPIYLRTGNLWPLGVVHGWLGTLAYPWLLGRDPWLEMMG